MNKHLVLSLDDSNFIISYFGGARYKKKIIPAYFLNRNSFKESFKNKFNRRISKIIINFLDENAISLNELDKVTVCCKETKITKQLKPNLPFLIREYCDDPQNFKKAKDMLDVFLWCSKGPITKTSNAILRFRRMYRV